MIDLEFKPYPWQAYCLLTRKKYNAWCIHRGAGKTYLIMSILAQAAMEEPGDYLYICPELKQARRNLWEGKSGIKTFLRPLQEITDENGKPANLVKFNEQYTTIEFWNGSRIYILGADDPDNLRGKHPVGYVVDETQDVSTDALDVLSGATANDPWIIYIGTPKSHNVFYQLFHDNQNNPHWNCLKLDVHQTKRKSNEQIEQARQEIIQRRGNDAFFRQEYLCDWDAAVSGAYYASLMQIVQDEGRIREVMYDPSFPVHTSWDLGTDCTAVWFFQTIHEQVRFIDYLQMPNNEGLPQVIAHVKAKGYAFGSHIGPHDVNQRQANGQTKGDIANQHGIYFDVIDPRLSVDEGIDAVRRLLPRCVFDKYRCAEGIECLKQYSPNVNKEGVITKPKHDKYSHGADSMRYCAVNINEIVDSTIKPRTPAHLLMPARKAEWSIWE